MVTQARLITKVDQHEVQSTSMYHSKHTIWQRCVKAESRGATTTQQAAYPSCMLGCTWRKQLLLDLSVHVIVCLLDNLLLAVLSISTWLVYLSTSVPSCVLAGGACGLTSCAVSLRSPPPDWHHSADSLQSASLVLYQVIAASPQQPAADLGAAPTWYAAA